MYPNLKKGVRLLFIGELGLLIFSVVSAFLQATELWAQLICAAAQLAFAVIVLVALGNAGKDDEDIHTAFKWQIGVLVIIVLETVLRTAFPQIKWFSYTGILIMVAELLTYFYVINTCNAIMVAAGKPEISDLGRSTWKLVVTCTLIEFITLAAISIILAFSANVNTSQIILGILLFVAVIVYVVINIIYYIKYLTYLKKVENNL